MTDQELYSAIRSGGRQMDLATQHLLKSNAGMMHDVKKKLHLTTSDIKDQYADAISHLIWNVRRGKFNAESKVSTYLYRILYNKSVDYLRHISTYKNKQTSNIAYLAIESDEQVEKNTYTNIASEQVKNEIKSMGEPCQGILIDWAYWGYTMKEIAERNVLDNAEIAKKKKYNCLQKLRKILKAKKID